MSAKFDENQELKTATNIVADDSPAQSAELIKLDERYEVVGIIGEGGMGKVYRARHAALGREVAVKVLKAGLAADPITTERFQREARAASAMTHPNLVAVHDHGTTEHGEPFLVMDYCAGQSLSEILKTRKTLTVRETIDIARQVAAALAHAHGRNIVHRDLKPANILMVADTTYSASCSASLGTAKVADFGIAKSLEPQSQQMTRTGEVFGTPFYMSPEQANGQPVDGRTDIYSLGCLIYECLAGHPPFVGDTPIATLVKHLHERIPDLPPTVVATGEGQALHNIIRKCLAKEREDRYQTAEELISDLLKAENAQPVTLPAAQRGRRRWLARMAITACLFVALVMAAVGLSTAPTIKVESTLNPRQGTASYQVTRQPSSGEQLVAKQKALDELVQLTSADRASRVERSKQIVQMTKDAIDATKAAWGIKRDSLDLQMDLIDKAGQLGGFTLPYLIDQLNDLESHVRDEAPGSYLQQRVLTALGRAHHFSGHWEISRDYYKRALKLLDKLDDSDPKDKVVLLTLMGNNYANANEPAKGLPYLKEAIAVHDTNGLPQDWTYSVTKAQYGKAMIEAGQVKQGKALLTEALTHPTWTNNPDRKPYADALAAAK